MTRERAVAVRRAYRRRGGRRGTRLDASTLYGFGVLAVLYVVPAVFLVGRSLPGIGARLDPDRVLAIGGSALALAVGAAVVVGRLWGPVLVAPFLLHVLRSSDLEPAHFLGPIAARRSALVGAAVGVVVVPATVALVSEAGGPGRAVVAGASSALVVIALAAAWCWGQMRSIRSCVVLVLLAAGYLALATRGSSGSVAVVPSLSAAAGRPLDGQMGIGLAVQAVVTLGIVVLTARSARRIDLDRLAQESARASVAGVFVGTGTFHDALELYRPLPAGLRRALGRPDGRRPGLLAQGVVRCLRTPGRSLAAAVLLLAGSAAMVTQTSTGLVLGAASVYLGSGWIAESWRGLRDEIARPPLFGPRRPGAVLRGLGWPVGASVLGVAVGGTTSLALFAATGANPASWAVVADLALGVTIALAARFLREMKSQMPLSLLMPIPSAFGDLSIVRILLWQVDSLLVVAIGAGLVDSLPLPWGAAVTLASLVGCAVGGLARGGSSIATVARWGRPALRSTT